MIRLPRAERATSTPSWTVGEQGFRLGSSPCIEERCGASSSPTRGPASAHLGWPLRSGERGGAWVDLDQVHAHQPARLGHLLGDVVDLAVGEAAWAVINYQ